MLLPGGTLAGMQIDRHYTDPRLVAVYDVENAARHDTDFYLDLAAELEAERVADLGCGTGVLACDLAARGHRVTGIDPATAMLDVARSRPGADEVTWVEGTAADLADAAHDLVVMTGHVAQVFLDDDEWLAVLGHVHRGLAPGGFVAFESRNPAVEPWRSWNKVDSFATFLGGDGAPAFDSWVETIAVGDGRVELVGHTEFHHPEEEHAASSTLRFRTRDELDADLAAAGFEVVARYGTWVGGELIPSSREMIFLAAAR